MSYNRRNILTRMVKVQNIVLAHTAKGVSQQWVFENIVHPTYGISKRTFYSYLGENAKSELRKFDDTASKQLTLFN